ncbi:MAG TPA: endonuclease III domain-containing protein [Methylomirabilota bacterium]|nr:endonuclease III domain-containing protein [Methylomirabilota bacterium]
MRYRPLKTRRDPIRGRLIQVYLELARHFSPQKWWPAESAIEVAVGAILTQNTAWTNVERALDRLKAHGLLSAKRLHQLSESRLATLIRPSGTFRVKARRLKAFLRFLQERYAGELSRTARVPLEQLRGELLSVHGIGPETADSMLLYAIGRPVFVVDQYTRRVLSRHRLVRRDIGYDDLQQFFASRLPSDPALFNDYHALLVKVGKEYCRRVPRCDRCPLRFDLHGRLPRL